MSRITDHALLRWLERSGALDVEQVRHALDKSLERAMKAAAEIGASHYLIVADGLTYVVRGGNVVTVLRDEGVHDHARRLGDRRP